MGWKRERVTESQREAERQTQKEAQRDTQTGRQVQLCTVNRHTRSLKPTLMRFIPKERQRETERGRRRQADRKTKTKRERGPLQLMIVFTHK